MRSRIICGLALLCAVALQIGCGEDDTYSPALEGPGSPTFTLTVAPPSRTVSPGGSATYTVTVLPVNGFSDPVSLSASGLPAGASATFDPSTVTPGAARAVSTLTVTTNSAGDDRQATPAGTFTITVSGSGGGVTRHDEVQLVVAAPGAPSFTLAATPPSRTITQGASTTYTVTLTSQNGFAGPVTLSVAAGLPTGATASFSPNPQTPSGSGAASTLTINTLASTPVSTNTLTIRGTAGGLTREDTVTLAITAGTAPAVLPLDRPVDLAFDRTGEILYVANAGGFISQARISGDGSLIPTTPPTDPAGTSPSAIVSTESRPGVYSTAFGDSAVFQFVSQVASVLDPLSPTSVTTRFGFGVGGSPNDIAADPNGGFVYTANGDNSVSQFRINADNTLTAIGGQDFTHAPTHANGITVEGGGRFAYAVGSQSPAGEAIFGYRINANGTLTEIDRAGTGALVRVLVDNTQQFLYATDWPTSGPGGGILQFRVNADGTLTALSPAIVSSARAWALAEHPDLPVVYVTNADFGAASPNTVSQFRVNANGALTPLSPATVPTGGTPLAVAVTPDAKFAYVANNQSNSISRYRVNANGTLTPL